MIRVHYVGNDLFPDGTTEDLPGVAYTVMDDDTVSLTCLDSDGEPYNCGVIHKDRWQSVVVVNEEGRPVGPKTRRFR